MIPLLRCRTEHSYKTVYGPVETVAERLRKLGCEVGGAVDTHGTWGHVPWQRELRERGIDPAFGTELVIPDERGRKPVAWCLAEDIKAFYNLSSNFDGTAEELAQASGVVRFAGDALTDPETFDYVDLNHQSLLAARRALNLAKHTNMPLCLAPVNDYPGPEHYDKFMAWADNTKMAAQHMMGMKELRAAYHWLDDFQFRKACNNAYEVGQRVRGIELPVAPMISVDGDLWKLVKEGMKYRLKAGHIEKWDTEYEKRLQREMAMIFAKKYESYFIVVADLVAWSKERMLVGPARGSSAGSLVCYLLRITEVDPLPHGLLFERFIDVNRDDLPDIDIDFSDTRRHLAFEYLAEKYGQPNVARIGSINTLKPRSAMAHVCKKLGINPGATFPVLNVLIEYSSGDARYGKGLEDTLENTQPGRDFMATYPEAKLMGELEGHATHTGIHAAGIIVSNVPVIDYCTVRDGVAQLDKKDAEKLNLLKIDALGLRTLGVIEDTGCVTGEELFALKMDDPEVFSVFNDEKFSGLFQFEGAAQRSVSRQVYIDSFQQIDHITALARPGPLGGGASDHYINRAAEREEIEYTHPTMRDYLEETLGVVLYQEQVMRIVRELGDFSWEETSVIRKAMSGRKGKEFFDRRGAIFAKGAAKKGVDPDVANDIWDQICSFGAWGMNKSHTVSYAMISYWCAYMKRYHPIEYAAALMRNAKDDSQIIEMLRELSAEGIKYVPFDPELSEANWTARDGKLIGGYLNLVGIGPVKAARYVQKRATEGLTEKDLATLGKLKCKYKELRPAHALWGHIYDNPHEYNVFNRIEEFADMEDYSEPAAICQLIRKERRDENETRRIAKRGGRVYDGDTLFLDMFVVDDSVAQPIRLRIKPRQWKTIGIKLADRAVNNEDWFLVRGKWLGQFSMMTVHKIKCLTNPEIFQ